LPCVFTHLVFYPEQSTTVPTSAKSYLYNKGEGGEAMRLADYFEGQLPTDEEMEAFSPEEYDEMTDMLLEGLEAFLADAEGNPEADPEEVVSAQVLLKELRETRQVYFDAVVAEERATVAYEEACERTRQAQELLRQSFAALSDQDLRTLMQQTQKQYGAASAEFQKLLSSLRIVAPERVALALDS
jgi:hypothetical protein